MIKALLRTRQTFCKAVQMIQRQKTKISKFQLKNYSDNVKLSIVAGKGGNGMISYFTSKTIRVGAPDGGDGGRGGTIVAQAHKSLHDLSHLRLKTIDGVDGRNGGATGRMGKNGGQTVIRVPCGTLIYEVKLEEDRQNRQFLVDLGSDKEQIVLANGGAPGKGNKMHPGMAESQRIGLEGQKKIIYFQLKTLADIGLVGLPNIGKSTFLAATTRAMPKIANYDFTTLKPSVGHVKFVDDYFMTIADIPGIIEDAHKNKGLGLEFLKHIQRTKILVFMLDITHKDPLDQYRILEKELQEYKNGIFKSRKRVVVFNKRDCLRDSELKFKILAERISVPTFLISAKEGQGVGQVLVHLRAVKEQIDAKDREEEQLRKIQEGNAQRKRQ